MSYGMAGLTILPCVLYALWAAWFLTAGGSMGFGLARAFLQETHIVFVLLSLVTGIREVIAEGRDVGDAGPTLRTSAYAWHHGGG
jgi:hypothetical protein